MTKHELDIAYFLSFCIENYKTHIGMPGDAVMDLLWICLTKMEYLNI